MLRILLCDDREDRGEAGAAALVEATQAASVDATVTFLGPERLPAQLDLLQKRRQEGSTVPEERDTGDSPTLDAADIVFMDFDLLDLEGQSADSGDNAAFLARCFSACGLIVSLNQFGTTMNSFDLRLGGHVGSFADVDLSSDQLGNPGLWRWPFEGFRPWSWPLLPAAVAALDVRTAWVAARMDSPIMEALGLDPSDLPASHIDPLGAGAAVGLMTFGEFADRSPLVRPMFDKPGAEVPRARLVASRLAKWLEELVAPGQDILVDAPHLVERYPSLLAGEPTDRAVWDALADPGRAPADLPLDATQLTRAEFEASDWISRPVWLWPAVRRNEQIAEVKSPWQAVEAPYRFAEDRSRFFNPEEVEAFEAELSSPYVRRHRARNDVGMVNRDGAAGKAIDPNRVNYEPTHRLLG